MLINTTVFKKELNKKSRVKKYNNKCKGYLEGPSKTAGGGGVAVTDQKKLG